MCNKDQNLTSLEKMMLLLPFRHQEDIHAYNFVINYMNLQTDPIWNNFKKHTMIKYEYLKEHGHLPDRVPKPESNFVNNDKFKYILEKDWDSSLQTKEIVSNIATTLIKFLQNNFENPEKNVNNMIIVSLSGGVDSMVILYILAIMRNGFINNSFHVVAVHLDYHNREETGLEAEFLMRWCNIMNIPLYYRYVHEGIRERNSSLREEYEELTKQIRFDMYHRVKNIYHNYHFMGVILGHHKGDLQENVFFNLMKGRTLTDLTVIKEQSEILGINICRPLLGVTKKEIFEIAHKNNIPYFKNTTPSWSNRGQYREVIQPSIIKTFGEGVLSNLSKISQESDELQLLIKSNIILPYIKTIFRKDNQYIFPKIKNQSFTFWKYVFHEFCHQNKIALISHKLIQRIYEKLYMKYCSNITINVNTILIINNEHMIYRQIP
jgi:tRNA(Ile)-lysidine synthetase-like protein